MLIPAILALLPANLFFPQLQVDMVVLGPVTEAPLEITYEADVELVRRVVCELNL